MLYVYRGILMKIRNLGIKRCKRVTGTKDKPLWLWIDGFCYAFDEEGKMYYDCITSDGFEVDKNGAWIK